MRPNWSHQTSQMAMLVLMMILVVGVQFIVPTTIDPKLTALDCDFERGDLCNWKAPASSSSFKVGMPKENQNSLYYPFEDHTEHSSDGHFAYINGSNSFNQASGIMQTINPYPKQKVCFSFVYYFYANGNNALASLTLNMNGQTGSVPVFRAYEANELKWREVTITIDPNNTFYDTFMFKARVKIGVIAIDDIVVRPGECRERRGRKVCDYESSGGTCLFAPSDAQSKWTVMQGYAVDFGIRDHTDHTIYGHFYGIRFNQLDKSSAKQFSIQTKTIHENMYKCFRFAYFMQNVTPNTTLYYEIISDYIGRTLKPFEVSGSTMGMWLTHHYSLASLQENTFMMYHLKMTIDTGGVDPGYGRVFIDDVVFDTEPCEYGTVCDFENGDTCDLEAVPYYRTQSASYNAFLTRTKNYTKITSKYLSDYVDLMWHVFTPRQSSHFVQKDHSLGTSIGKYLLLNGADSYKRGIITTTRYQLSTAINGTFCFSFALYKPDSGTILEVYQGESSDSANGLKLWDIQRATNGWEVIDIENTLQNSSSKDIFFFLVGTIVNSGGAYLAIDDVQMASSRVCRPSNVLRSNPSTTPTSVITTTANPLTTFTCKSGKQISIDKTCDWVNDCEQGEDEMNCGSCDFVNHNLCRYKINAISNRYKYIFSDQGTDGPQSGSHSNSLYLITNGTFGSTFLDSPTIHQSYSQCELSFSYNYNTSDPTNVSLYLYLTFVDINIRFLIWQSNTSPILQHFWQKVILRLGRLTHPFRMSFVADTRYSTTKPVQSIGYQAIDLISMQNCAPPKALSNVECRNAFRCTNQVCIDSAFVCDLQDDCGDGSDEVACDKTLMTSFEFGLNRWGEGEISGWKVVKALFSSDLRRRPTFDHTTGYSHGSYLFAEVNEQIAQGTQKSIVAQIDSPPFSILANSGCDIRFYMFKYLRNSSLLVKLKNLNTSKERILLKLSFPRNRFVRYHQTVFPESVPSSVYKVVVTAILNVTYDDTIKRNTPYIALDDITFSRECILMPAGNNISVSTAKPDCPTLSCLSSNGTQICLSVNQFCDFVHDCKDGSDEVNCGDCDFDHGQMCGWKDIPVDTRHGWTVIKPASIAPRQLPALDANGNSTGGYAAIYTSYNGVLNYNVYLRSPLINADTSRKCKLRLSYFARSKATFLVGLAKERNVFFSSSQASPQWQSFVVDIGRQKAGFGIDLVASTTFATPSLFGSVWYKDVAVDNLKLVDCDPNQSDKPNANETITCDFEQDLCGWNIIGATQRSKWQRTSDAHREPGNDHTSLKDPTPVRSGTWLTSQTLVNSASETDYLATAIPIQAGQVYCLSFWYYFLEIDISSYIGLFISKTPEADIGPLTTPKYTALWLSTRSEVRNWNQKHVDIAAQTEDFYLIFVARVSATSVVGLDDFEFRNGSCPVMSGEFCDFEVNNCGWTVQGKQWQRSTQPGTYPDHTTGTSQGHYLQVATSGQSVSIVKQMNTLGYDIPIRRQFCLRLFYLIDSIEQNQQVVDHASRLTIRAHNPGAFDVPQSKVVTIEDTFNEGQLRQWTMVTFNFIAFIRSNVEIEALVNSSSTKMLLDDIRFNVGFCEAEGNCNFERDMCGWYNVPRSVSTQVNSLWLRIRPSSRYIASSVLHYDHTTNTVSGNYLVMPLQAQDRSFSMIQSPLIHKTSESVCLTLYYFAQSSQSASGAFKLSLIDLTHKFRVAYLLVEATPKLEWTKYSRQFANLPKTFAFQIEAQYSTYLLSDIGLDDIVITEGDCVRNVQLSTTTPEPPTEKTLDCNFDNGQCNWDFDVNNWLVTNGKTVKIQYAPALDHTYQTALGKYLLFNQSSSTKIDYSIRSKSNITYNRDHCLTVWYYEDGEKPFALQINAILPDGTIRPLKVFATAIENRQRWNVLKVNVPLELASNVTSIGLEMVYSPANKQYVSIFALDDIRVLPNKCKHTLDYVYTFDNGIEDLELQFIAPKGNVRGIGQRVVPFLYRPKGAPTVDHTFNTVKGSYFLFMNLNLFTTARDYIDTLSMVDLPPESRPSCVRFAYQIYGNVTLKLYLGPWNIPLDDPSYYRYLSNPWTSKYSKTSWTLYEFTKQVGYRHKVVLYMEKQLDKTSFVAIDDLTILSHACQLMINCDFEDGRYCSYTPFHDQNTSDYNFGIYRALTEQNTNWLGPRFDHTTRSYGGGYLYLTAYRTTKPFPEIISKIISGARQVDSTKSYCLSMWTRFITADVKVRLYLVRFGENWTDDNRTIQMSTLENSIQVDWRQFSVTINPSLLVNTGEVQLIIEGRLGANSKGIIAIDDILWSDGRCQSSDALICENGTPIKSEQICNFVKDCPSGMDEFNCGNCDFEDGSTCGWLNVTHSTPWLLTSWRETSNGKAPKFDGSRNMKGHYLLVGKAAVAPTTNTEMALNHQTPSMYLKNAFKSCLMRFDYFVQITGDYAFNVRIGTNLNDWATIYSISQVPTGVWRSAYVHIGERYSPFMVDFYGHFTDDTAVMAIDNVQFVNCSLPAPMAANQQCSASQYFCQRNRFCISLDDVCDYVNDCGDNSDEPSTCASATNRCNFEYSLATCGITIEDDNAEWFKQRGGVVHGDPYKPTIDNTRRSSLGNFLELLPNNAQSGSSSGSFFSPMMTSSEGKSCRVRFFYFINGDPVTISSSFIAIYVRYANKLVPEHAPIASIRVDIANAVQQRWNKAVAQFSSSSTPFQFAFRGRLFGKLSRIAVDDITYGLDCVPSAIKPLSVQSTTSAPGTSPFPSSTTPGITLNQHNRKPNSAGTVVAAVLTPLLLVAGIVLGYYGYRRYQTSKRTEDNLNVLTMKSLQKRQND